MIQARSLSGVVDLADNPPSASHGSFEIVDPLVLYIARVPGSRGKEGWERIKAGVTES